MEMRKITLGDCIIDCASGPFGSNLKVECFVEDGFPIIDGANLKGVRVTDNITKFVTEEKARSLSRSIAKRRDVIVTISGTLGQISFIPNDSKYNEYLCSQRQFRVTFDESKIDVEYLVNYLHTDFGQKKILSFANYVGVPALAQPLPNFKKIELLIPSIQNQKKVVQVLSALDDKIALNKKMNQKLEAMAKRLYDYWFVQYDFPDKNGHPYKTTGAPMTYNPTLKREIPAGWEVDNLYAVADYINGLACQNKRPKSGENALPVIKIREMSEGITSDTEEVSENIPLKYIVENGDILFSWSATLMVMIWAGGKGGLNQHIFKVVPKAGFPKEFVYQLLSDYVVNFQQIALSRKTTMGHITSDHINLSRVVLPPENVLKRYAEKVCPIFDKVVRNQVEYRKLTTLRDKLLPLLMNGQVIVD